MFMFFLAPNKNPSISNTIESKNYYIKIFRQKYSSYLQCRIFQHVLIKFLNIFAQDYKYLARSA